MRARGLAALLAAAGIAGSSVVAEAQQVPVQRYLEQAKQHILNLNADSAAPLLLRVIDPSSGAGGSQRSWAFALLALVRLAEQNSDAAQQMFRQALGQDPRLPGDSIRALLDLDSQADVVYQQALTWWRNQQAGPIGVARDTFAIEFYVSPDTTLRRPSDSLAVTSMPARPARTVLTVRTVDPPAVVFRSDTLAAAAASPLIKWLPRDAEGRPLRDGSYTLELTGVDQAGAPGRPASWTMQLRAVQADTQPFPRPLGESAFLPETTQVRSRSTATLLAGAGLGVAAALLPTAFGQSNLNSGLSGDGTAYLVAGGVAVAGVVGFLNGRREEFSPQAAAHNDSLRTRYSADSLRVATGNARARLQRPIQLVRPRSPN